jgi:phage gp45-like
MLQVQIADPDDIQSVEYLQAAGQDYNPPPGTAVLIVDLGRAWKVAIAADDAIEPSVSPGEFEIYSHAGGVRQASIKWLLSGIIEAHSVTGVSGLDFVALAQKVLTELQAVQSDFNALKGVFDAHTHIYSPGPSPAAPTAPPAAPAPTPHTPASVASTNLKADN